MFANMSWKKGLLFGVGLLFAACCGLGAIASKYAPAKTAEKPPEATEMEPTTIPTVEPTAAPTEVPCKQQIATWANSMVTVIQMQQVAFQEGSDGNYSDARSTMQHVREFYNTIKLPTCEPEVEQFDSLYQDFFDNYETMADYAIKGDFETSVVYAKKALENQQMLNVVLGRISERYK